MTRRASNCSRALDPHAGCGTHCCGCSFSLTPLSSCSRNCDCFAGFIHYFTSLELELSLAVSQSYAFPLPSSFSIPSQFAPSLFFNYQSFNSLSYMCDLASPLPSSLFKLLLLATSFCFIPHILTDFICLYLIVYILVYIYFLDHFQIRIVLVFAEAFR